MRRSMLLVVMVLVAASAVLVAYGQAGLGEYELGVPRTQVFTDPVGDTELKWPAPDIRRVIVSPLAGNAIRFTVQFTKKSWGDSFLVGINLDATGRKGGLGDYWLVYSRSTDTATMQRWSGAGWGTPKRMTSWSLGQAVTFKLDRKVFGRATACRFFVRTGEPSFWEMSDLAPDSPDVSGMPVVGSRWYTYPLR